MNQRDIETLLGVEQALNANAHQPTLRELAQYIGVKDHNGAYYRVQRLVTAKAITRKRGIVAITDKGKKLIQKAKRVQ